MSVSEHRQTGKIRILPYGSIPLSVFLKCQTIHLKKFLPFCWKYTKAQWYYTNTSSTFLPHRLKKICALPQLGLKTSFCSSWTGRDKLASQTVTLWSFVVSVWIWMCLSIWNALDSASQVKQPFWFLIVTLLTFSPPTSVLSVGLCVFVRPRVFVQVFCSDRQQYTGTDKRWDGNRYPDSFREPGGAGTVLHC